MYFRLFLVPGLAGLAAGGGELVRPEHSAGQQRFVDWTGAPHGRPVRLAGCVWLAGAAAIHAGEGLRAGNRRTRAAAGAGLAAAQGTGRGRDWLERQRRRRADARVGGRTPDGSDQHAASASRDRGHARPARNVSGRRVPAAAAERREASKKRPRGWRRFPGASKWTSFTRAG